MSGAERTALAARVRAALSRDRRIHAWQLRSERQSGLQTYLVKTELESDRRVENETLEVNVFVRHEGMLGHSSVTLAAGDAGRLEQRIGDAVYMAGLGGDAPWTLPAAATWPRVESFDATLAADRVRETSRGLVEAWRAAVAAHPEARPSSMELFCGASAVTLENSAGLVARSESTRVSLLTLLLADGARPAERYSWDERRRVADLDVSAIVARAAAEAKDLTRAVPPPSGRFAVVIDADEIANLLAPVQGNAAASGLYQKSSRFEVGKPLPFEPAGGEPLNLWSNALTPFGLTSYAFDGNGVAGQRVQIVKDNVFVRPWATKQYADYLAVPPTGGFANWELPAGTTPLAELTAGDAPVIYVSAFSWLTPDPARGNFGSEIRVGYLYDKGVRTPIKGGTVSGNVFTALGTARYSRESRFRGDYTGPSAIRFEGLTVAGS